MRKLRALLDANVLVDAQARDFFCRLAEVGLLDLRWSAEILEETRRALVDRLHLDPSKVNRLIDVLSGAFPEAVVDDYGDLLASLDLPDPDDRHVAAAALRSGCDYLITDNVSDFPVASLGDSEFHVLSVDHAISLLVTTDPLLAVQAVSIQIQALRRPSVTEEAFVARLGKRRPMGAAYLGAALGLDGYANALHDLAQANSPMSPHDVVQRIVDALRSDDGDELLALVDPELGRRLTGHAALNGEELCAALDGVLEGVKNGEGWGVAAGVRPQGTDWELVKLVQDAPLLVTEPTFLRAHLCWLRFGEGRWRLIDIGGDDPAFSSPPVHP